MWLTSKNESDNDLLSACSSVYRNDLVAISGTGIVWPIVLATSSGGAQQGQLELMKCFVFPKRLHCAITSRMVGHLHAMGLSCGNTAKP
eukprot:COSAG02_NODE_1578_length_11853_cov_3.734048_9_plen_89_part_00